jgi:VWFA-related protein
VKEILIAALGLALGAQPLGQQQTTTPLPSAPQPQQQTIPDAPRPQVPGLGSVAPGKAATPDSATGSSTSASGDDADQPPVGSTLPQSKTPPPADVDQAPITPEHYTDIYQLPAITVNYVEIPFTVKDSKGHLVPGLTYRDVHVYENNVRQKMQVFTVEPFPLSVAVVIDQSLPVEVMKRVNTALGQLPNVFAPYDEVAVFTYNNGPHMQTDFTAGTSARLAAVIDRAKTEGRENMYYAPGEGLGAGININSGAQHDMTPLDGSHTVGSPGGVAQVPREVHTLNDAILAAAVATSKAARGRRRIVYVISDGKEYGSKAKQKEVIKYLQENKVQVYATVVGDSSLTGLGFVSHLHLPLMMRDNVLPVFTGATGGEAYADFRTKAIEESFGKITAEERSQYTIGYNTREPLIDGKFRKVDVRVLRPNLEVIAKDGYWPSAVAVTQPPARPATKPTTPPQP